MSSVEAMRSSKLVMTHQTLDTMGIFLTRKLPMKKRELGTNKIFAATSVVLTIAGMLTAAEQL